MFDYRRMMWAVFALLIIGGHAPSSAQNRVRATGQELTLPSARIAASGLPIKCGLQDAVFVQQNRANFSIAQQNEFKGYVVRPPLENSYVSPTGRFKVHYNISGVHGIDTTTTNSAGVPDWVYEAALAAEVAYDVLVNEIGFNPHLSDNGIDGPECDIYIVDTGAWFGESYYGATVPESASGSGYISYMTVENDFAENFYTKGLDALRVTIAHEYFHTIHYGYRYRDEDLFFWEMSSTWFEDRAYPEINDYYVYLPSFFRTMDDPLHTQDGWHEYGSCIFLKYLLNTQGEGTLLTIWNTLSSLQAVYAMDSALKEKGNNFVEALAEFAGWCFYTGSRAQQGSYFEDAAEFPRVRYRDQVDVQGEMTLNDSTRALSVQFFQFKVDASSDFRVEAGSAGSGIFGLAGNSEQLTGELGLLQVRGASVPFALAAMENDGLVNLAVVNGALPSDVKKTTSLLPPARYSLDIRLQALEPQPAGFLPARPNPFIPTQHGSVTLLYNLLESATVSLKIVSEAGQPVLEEQLGRRGQGLFSYDWNGKNRDGANVASGIYLAILTTSTSEHFMTKIAVLR